MTIGRPYGFFDYREKMRDAIQKGPFVTSIMANTKGFQGYKTGIFDLSPQECPAETTDHSMLVVGYGGAGTQQYFIA